MLGLGCACLIDPQAAVLLPLAVVRLLSDPKAFADRSHGAALGKLHLGFTQLGDNLLRRKTLPRHGLGSRGQVKTSPVDLFSDEPKC